MEVARLGRKYVLVMVGLPARGKTYTARKLAGYLSWLGYETRVFNVGDRRRQQLGAHQTHEFFDPANQDAEAKRLAVASELLEELVAWLSQQGRVAIYDATNTTRARRAQIRRRCEAEDFSVLFVEVINDESEVIEANVRETKLSSPDYAGMDPERAVADFRTRIAHYERVYERVDDAEGAYIQLIDRGRKEVMHAIEGYLPSRIVFFLSNLEVTTRSVRLTRHGQSLDNVRETIGGDSALSAAGRRYAKALAQEVESRMGPGDDLQIWTSTLVRALETAEPLRRSQGEVVQWRALDEIGAGLCDGWTYDEIRERMPQEYEARRRDKLRYRYPRGESYEDVIQRVDRVIIEIERQRTPVLVIAHQAVLRVLYSYLRSLPRSECPYVSIPLHTVIELTPRAYGVSEERRALAPQVSEASSSA